MLGHGFCKPFMGTRKPSFIADDGAVSPCEVRFGTKVDNDARAKQSM
jgi:hypothetical protein